MQPRPRQPVAMDLNQVTLPAVDLPASVAFYQRMGFRQIVDSPHYTRFNCPTGNATFSIHQADPPLPEHDLVIYFETTELDENYLELTRLGIKFSQPPTDKKWLWREARLIDPAGNVLCLYHAGKNRKFPPWRIDVKEQ